MEKESQENPKQKYSLNFVVGGQELYIKFQGGSFTMGEGAAEGAAEGADEITSNAIKKLISNCEIPTKGINDLISDLREESKLSIQLGGEVSIEPFDPIHKLNRSLYEIGTKNSDRLKGLEKKIRFLKQFSRENPTQTYSLSCVVGGQELCIKFQGDKFTMGQGDYKNTTKDFEDLCDKLVGIFLKANLDLSKQGPVDTETKNRILDGRKDSFATYFKAVLDTEINEATLKTFFLEKGVENIYGGAVSVETDNSNSATSPEGTKVDAMLRDSLNLE